ncbi:hypothetical protein PVK06_015574 [Gossypium arboreum]|uniref:Uncharacterized protein n=1 Tax=Gossypium arboreum TaxID=29729 RepID=A0ABR0PXL2_GOSAR|nr:hypothetical protein PVK06_015574 [Gossypium arboreum]
MDIENEYFLAKFQPIDDYAKVEYEGLPTIFFTCGKYGHTKELCVSLQLEISSGKDQSGATLAMEVSEGESAIYGPWMVVEKKIRRNSRSRNLSTVDFQDRGKSGIKGYLEGWKFIVQLRLKNWGNPTPKRNEQIGGARVDFELLNTNRDKPTENGPVGRLPTVIDFDNGAAGPTVSKTDMDCSVLSQPNGVLGPSSAEPILQNKEEESEGDGSNMQTKSNSSVPELFDIQVADSSGGLNSNRHTAISFNEEGTVGGDLIRKINVSPSGVSTLRSIDSKVIVPDPVEKVMSKLQNWEVRKLSFAGHVTLAQSVLLAIPNYFMQSMLVLKGVCDEIEKIARQFIWNLELLRLWLPDIMIKRIVSIPPPHLDGGVDKIIWARSASRSFSVRSPYWARVHRILMMMIGSPFGSTKAQREFVFFYGL